MFLELTETDISSIVKPVIDICQTLVPVLITLVGVVGAIYCIILGVKFARADDPQEHEKAKNALKYAIIGFVLIFVLLIMLKVGTYILNKYYLESIKPYN